MSTTESPSRIRPTLNVETKSSSFDRVNAALIAGIILFGFLFSVLFLIWLTTVLDFSRPLGSPIVKVDSPGNNKPKGVADDVLEPGVEEFPEVETPQLANALESLTTAVSNVRGAIDQRSGDADQVGKGGGFGSRQGGPGSGGDGIPEHERWVINFEADSIKTYAQQLDFFNIEIGIIHRTKNDIWRVRRLSSNPEVARSSRANENETLRFTHKKAQLRRWDQQLAQKAGVDILNTVPSQFYPESTRVIIRTAEANALQGTDKEVSDIRRTTFKVESNGNGFAFNVVEVEYR